MFDVWEFEQEELVAHPRKDARPKIAAISSIVKNCRNLAAPVRAHLADVPPGLADRPIQPLERPIPTAHATRMAKWPIRSPPPWRRPNVPRKTRPTTRQNQIPAHGLTCGPCDLAIIAGQFCRCANTGASSTGRRPGPGPARGWSR